MFDVSSYIFTELLNGGDLYSYLQIQNMEVPEADAQVIVYQILQGVEYLHRHGVVHRDLKLENVLMTTFEANGRVVITDFGQARHVPKRRSQQGRAPILRMNTRVGTSGYKAP
jgi:pheromone a factor receptor